MNKKTWCDEWNMLKEKDQLMVWAMFGKDRLREQFKNDFENLASPVYLLRNAKYNFRLYGFNKECNRCNGSGNYSYNQRTGRTCFKCIGTKYELVIPEKRDLDKFILKYPEGIRYSEDLKNGMIKGKGKFLAKFDKKEAAIV